MVKGEAETSGGKACAGPEGMAIAGAAVIFQAISHGP